jgi:hypothetical protein
MSVSLSAFGLLKFVPEIVNLFSSRTKKKDSIQLVSKIAQEVTGEKNVDSAVKALENNPELVYNFQLAVMENDTVLERLDEKSRQRASGNYNVSNKQADKMADITIQKNPIYILALILLQTAFTSAIIYFKVDNPALVTMVSSVIGSAITSLFIERQQVYSFYYGSSLGSKIKDILGKATSKEGEE